VSACRSSNRQQAPAAAISVAASTSSSNRRRSKHQQSVMSQARSKHQAPPHQQSVMSQQASGTAAPAIGDVAASIRHRRTRTSNRRCHTQQGAAREHSIGELRVYTERLKGKMGCTVAESINTQVRDENISVSNLQNKAELNSVKSVDSTDFTEFAESTRVFIRFYQILILLPS